MPVKKTLNKPVKKEMKTPEVVPAVEEAVSTKETRDKKFCAFCQNKKEPAYTDAASLRRYFSERARIVSRQRSGACSKHQRRVSKEIKYARHLGLLPFVNKV